MTFISDVQYYVPINLCKTAGSMHLFKIAVTLKPGNAKLNWKYIWDTLEIDWKEVNVTFNSNNINLPKFVTIKLRGKFKIICMMKREPLLFHTMLTQGKYLVHFGFHYSRNCIRQYKYFSRMDFNFKAFCDFDFYYFHCAM